MTDILTTLRGLTFRAAFTKTVRASKATRASEAGQVSQPVQAKPSATGGLVQANHTFKKQV